MKKDRFDLEQDIMSLWGCADDLNKITEYIVDHPDFAGLSAKHCDEIGNLLFGLVKIMELKGQICFETFEKLVHDQQLEGHLVAPGNMVMYDGNATKYKFDPDPSYPMDMEKDGYSRGTLYRMID